jgi:hypothetical protein
MVRWRGKASCRKTRSVTVSGCSLFFVSVTTWPATEKSLSTGALVVGIAIGIVRYLRTTWAKYGNVAAYTCGESELPNLTTVFPTFSPRHTLHSAWCSQAFGVPFGHLSYLKVWSHTLFRVLLGFFSPHSWICLLINSSCCVFLLDYFTFWRSAVTVLHPCTTWVPTAVLTTETVLESVDSCPALSKTADDGPPPPGHSVPLVISVSVDDVEVCVSSGTMKNTLWVTPKRFRRL